MRNSRIRLLESPIRFSIQWTDLSPPLHRKVHGIRVLVVGTNAQGTAELPLQILAHPTQEAFLKLARGQAQSTALAI